MQASNELSGNIPDFSARSTLSYIDISHNNLNSTIPESWLDNRNLHYFSASFNLLHGTIPAPNMESPRITSGWPRECALPATDELVVVKLIQTPRTVARHSTIR